MYVLQNFYDTRIYVHTHYTHILSYFVHLIYTSYEEYDIYAFVDIIIKINLEIILL